MTNAMAQSAPVGHDPWDAPYFGAPVYLTYPDFAVAAPPLVAKVAPPPAAAPARRGWLARLFGRR
jgi:hypothetical protein